MQIELEALQSNNTWTITPLPNSKHVIVVNGFTRRSTSQMALQKDIKVGLWLKGCTQKYGIDYVETFSSVVKMTTIRLIICIAAAMYQMDINTAFLAQ